MNILESNFNALKNNTYPGRGIIVGLSPDSKTIYQIYWIMGRSSNSRNRIFAQEGDFIKTKAFDDSKLEDPSLIIYYPMKKYNNYHIVTNGDQTDTIYDFLSRGKSFEDAVNSRCFEPDAPNFTPRISNIVAINDPNLVCKISVNKTLNNDSNYPATYIYKYKHLIPSVGFLITTYSQDGNPLPSFCGEPVHIPIFDDIKTNLTSYWDCLDSENKISLFVKGIDLISGSDSILIINKFS